MAGSASKNGWEKQAHLYLPGRPDSELVLTFYLPCQINFIYKNVVTSRKLNVVMKKISTLFITLITLFFSSNAQNIVNRCALDEGSSK